MIPTDYINQWRKFAPWTSDNMIEQDLIILRAIVELFSNETIQNKLCFKGGTALHKLFTNPAARYSEDIDMSLTIDEPIGDVLSAIRQSIDPWLGKPRYSTRKWLTKFIYKVQSSTGDSIKLKIEINISETFHVQPYQKIPYSIESPWYAGQALITTYSLNEMLATKLRALYQRNKAFALCTACR